MIDPAVLRAMLNAGCTADQIVAVAEEAARAEEYKKAAKRAGNAERQRRFRQRNAVSRVTGVTNGDIPSDKEIPQTPKEINSPRSDPKGSSLTPRDELEIVLDADRAKAVVDHRKRIGKPLTAHAAKLLAGKFTQCADPNAAADEMISNGWQGFKPEWLENNRSHQQTAPPPKRTVGQQARDELRKMGLLGNATDDETRHIDQGDGSADFAGSGIARRFAIASSR